uniref:HOOK N-terminal domain-containing protein n=1 Tax=Meloidogyne hapla TaxID=6305 RepID=A0A1I8BG41_MELHA
MEIDADGILLTFMNLLTAELQIEEIFSFDEVRYLLPILIKMIQTGELTFKCDFDFKFKDAFDFIKTEIGEKSVELLMPENADNGDKQEITNIIFALLFILYKNQKAKFDHLCEKLDENNSAGILQLIKQLDNFDCLSPIPFTSILNNFSSSNNLFSNFQIFSSQNLKEKEEISKYKIKSAEFEAKYKKIEAINFKLNEQLGNAQNEFIDLENKYENLKQADNEKQGSIELLNIQLREITDELETSRYNNSQLQRELKSLNERHSRAFQKSANDLKSKEDEVRLLYIRLDALVKQITEKDSSENKLKFLEQQIANQQGTIGELRIGLEQALDRANIAETELIKYKRLHNNNISNREDNTNSQNDSDTSISLHDDLNSCKLTENHSNLNDSLDQISSQNDDFAKLKTRLELIQYEKRELEKE